LLMFFTCNTVVRRKNITGRILYLKISRTFLFLFIYKCKPVPQCISLLGHAYNSPRCAKINYHRHLHTLDQHSSKEEHNQSSQYWTEKYVKIIQMHDIDKVLKVDGSWVFLKPLLVTTGIMFRMIKSSRLTALFSYHSRPKVFKLKYFYNSSFLALPFLV